jgi:hypothetical protein
MPDATNSYRPLQQTDVKRLVMEVVWRSDTPVSTRPDGSVSLPMQRILGKTAEAICLVTHSCRTASATVDA